MPKKLTTTNNKSISLAAIDYSSSMIACFKESGIRRAKVAVETIKRFLLAGQFYCNSDTFKFYEIFMKANVKPEYDPEKFVDPSYLPDLLEKITNYILKNDSQNKRILLVTDAVVVFDDDDDEDQDDQKKLIETYAKIVNNQIILDIVLLKSDTQIAKELCAVSHMSGGYCCIAENLNDLYQFVECKNVIDLRERSNNPPSYFHEKILEKLSKDILTITKPKPYKINGFYPDIVLTSPLIKSDDTKMQNLINVCVNAQKSKEKFFSIYHLFDKDEKIDSRTIVVFLKSKNDVILQFYLYFPPGYPNEAPWFKLISNVEMKNDQIPNYFVQFKEYSKSMKLIDLINGLNETLQLSEVQEDLKGVISPIKSFDQIKLFLHVAFGEDDEDLDEY